LFFHCLKLVADMVWNPAVFNGVILVVVVIKQIDVIGPEFLQLYMRHDDKQVCEHLGSFRHEISLVFDLLVDLVSEVFGHEVTSLLLVDCVEVVPDLANFLLLSLDLLVSRAHFLTVLTCACLPS